jgi:hypothetical protein
LRCDRERRRRVRPHSLHPRIPPTHKHLALRASRAFQSAFTALGQASETHRAQQSQVDPERASPCGGQPAPPDMWRCFAPEMRCSSERGPGTTISHREPRRLVVCMTMVTRARSSSPYGTLSTTTGRTFSAMPQSDIQTSPRRIRRRSLHPIQSVAHRRTLASLQSAIPRIRRGAVLRWVFCAHDRSQWL